MARRETKRNSRVYWIFAVLTLLLGVALSASAAFAGLPANQVANPSAQAGSHSNQANDTGALGQLYSGPKDGPDALCTTITNGSITTTDPTQTNRLFRNGVADMCGTAGTCGTPIGGSFHYDRYTYQNQTAASACVSITLSTACTGTNFIYSGAYLTNFDQANICTNYLGSMGNSPNGAPLTYSVDIPAGATFVVVVTEVQANMGCASYTLTVAGDICPPAPTVTPNATVTPCPIQFTDVPSTNSFYAAIRCLACRGIVSGYADGTFRPNTPVTRGQLAKMVSNAAGFNEPIPSTQQTFEDVPNTNTFWLWIERLSTRGYMSGYTCGGLGEPCVSGKPYFRWGSNATRGQTAKIVSNAAMFTEDPAGQTFEDVPATNIFYPFIQRLASRRVMGGYPCGGPGEPCITGKPYFRPNNPVTRGQSAKIVANTFFPGCNPTAAP